MADRTALPTAASVALAIAACVGPRSANADDWALERPVDSAAKRSAAGLDREKIAIRRWLGRPDDRRLLDPLIAFERSKAGSLDGVVARVRARLKSASASQGARIWLLIGHLERANGNVDEAVRVFEHVATIAPELGVGRYLAELSFEQGEHRAGLAHLEQAHRDVAGEKPKRKIAVQLVGEYVRLGEFARAREWFVRSRSVPPGELGWAHALAGFGEHKRAAELYRRVRASARGRAERLDVLVRLGASLLAGHASREAVDVLKEALSLRPTGSLRRKVVSELIAAARSAGVLSSTLPELEARLSGAERVSFLATVYEELGMLQQSIDAYSSVLRRGGANVEVRVRLARLLTQAGDVDSALVHYRWLVRRRSTPGEVVLNFIRYLHRHRSLGDALREARAQERKRSRDGWFQERLLEFYREVSSTADIERVLARASTAQKGRSGSIAELGAELLASGERAGAIRTWQRVVSQGASRAQGQLKYARILADHQIFDVAADAYGEALRLASRDEGVQKEYAEVLERAGKTDLARSQWEALLEAENPGIRQVARRRLVPLWRRLRVLQSQTHALERRTESDPGDVDSTLLLVEIYRQRRSLPDAVALVRRAVDARPDSIPLLTSLERLHTASGHHQQAIAALEKLVKADRPRAAEYLARMAEHAQAAYRDDDAVRFSREATRWTPRDPVAFRRLGDALRARGDLKGAERAYRRALAIDKKGHAIALRLADSLISRSRAESAKALLFGIVEDAIDDQFVYQAGQRLLRLHLAAGELFQMHEKLLSLAKGGTLRTIHRRLLMEVIDGMDSADAKRAADRSRKAILDVLWSGTPYEQRVAIELLERSRIEGFVEPLMAFARVHREPEMRVRALRVAGAVAAPDHARLFLSFVGEPDRRLRIVAGWALVQIDKEIESREISALRESDDADLRAMSALRGWVDASSYRDPSDLVRAATVVGKAMRSEPVSVSRVLELRTDPSSLVRQAVAFALSEAAREQNVGALSELLFDESRAVAANARVALAGRRVPSRWAPVGDIGRGARSYMEDFFERWRAKPSQLSFSETRIAKSVASAAVARLSGTRGSVERFVTRLSNDDAVVALWQPDARPIADAVLSQIAARVGKGELNLRSTMRLLARLDHPRAVQMVLSELRSRDGTRRGVALRALAAGGRAVSEPVARKVAKLLFVQPSWFDRVAAAQVLTRVGGTPVAEAALRRAAKEDPFAFVRFAAACGLRHAGGEAAREVLRDVALEDIEPRVRQVALQGARCR